MSISPELKIRNRFIWLMTWLAIGVVSSDMVVTDPDIFGHLEYGLEHLESGVLTNTDPYNYTVPNAPWVNHEWLCEYIFAWLWSHFGAVGFWGMRLVLVTIMALPLTTICLRNSAGLWSVAPVFAAAWSTLAIGLAFRPQLFTYACAGLLLLLIWNIYIHRNWSIWQGLWFAPLLCTWTNLHGGFLFGVATIGFVGCWLIIELARKRIRTREFWIHCLTIGLGIAATFANPYGYELHVWLWKSLSVSRADLITEWMPVYRSGDQHALLGYYALLALGALVFVRCLRQAHLLELGLFAVFAIVSFKQVRHTVFLAMAALIILPHYIEMCFDFAKRIPDYHILFRRAIYVILAGLPIFMHSIPGGHPNTICISSSSHPLNMYRFMRTNKVEGNLLVFFNWAQSSIWYLKDQCKVAYDGRFRTVYPAHVEQDYEHFYRNTEQWNRIIDNYDTEIILSKANWPYVKRLAERDDWYRLHEIPEPWDHAVLFVRKDRFKELIAAHERGELSAPQHQHFFAFDRSLQADNDICMKCPDLSHD